MKTKAGMTKRSLCEFKGKIVPKSSLVGTKAQVFRGTKSRTAGGLTKKDLARNKMGKIVSKKKLAMGKKIFKKAGLRKWTSAVTKARKEACDGKEDLQESRLEKMDQRSDES